MRNDFLYEESAGGSETCGVDCFHNAEEREASLRRVEIVMDGVRNRLRLHGQGVYDSNGKLHSVEILSRIEQDGMLLEPDHFLPDIMATGKEVEFDEEVIRQALSEIEGMPDTISYAINVFKDTLHSDNFTNDVSRIVKNGTKGIVFELLEHNSRYSACRGGVCSNVFTFCRGHNRNVMKAGASLKDRINLLKENETVRFSVDDFPMGTNCMGMLHQLEGVDFVKFDGEWLNGLIESYGDNVDGFISHIISVIKNIRMIFPTVKFIAEKVSSDKTYQILRNIPDITLFQGYHFGRPVPLSEFRTQE